MHIYIYNKPMMAHYWLKKRRRSY